LGLRLRCLRCRRSEGITGNARRRLRSIRLLRSDVQVLIGDDFTFICDGCITEAARLVAERKARGGAP
jgi:hypothetical protein